MALAEAKSWGIDQDEQFGLAFGSASEGVGFTRPAGLADILDLSYLCQKASIVNDRQHLAELPQANRKILLPDRTMAIVIVLADV